MRSIWCDLELNWIRFEVVEKSRNFYQVRIVTGSFKVVNWCEMGRYAGRTGGTHESKIWLWEYNLNIL